MYSIKCLKTAKNCSRWIENGAYFFVCGDKQRMAKDVHNALIDVIEKEGNMSREEAEAYLNNIKEQGRYQRDVY